MINLSYFLTRSAAHYRSKPSFFFKDEEYTYAYVNERVSRLASGLTERGLKKGDRVGIITDSEPRGLECLFAPLRAGMTIVPIGPKLHPKEQSYILMHSDAKVLLCGRRFLEGIAEEHKYFPPDFKIIAMDSRGCGIKDVEDYENVLTEGDPSFPDADIEGDDLAWLFYTSGTTGRPKGAMLTYRALLSMITTQLIENNPLCQDDRFVYLTALSHGSGLATFLQVARGACHVFPGKMSFDPEYFYQLVERYKVTVAIMVPTMIEMLLGNPNHRKYDLSSLRTIAYGAAPMYKERIREAISTFGPIFVQTYALGEAPRGCTCLQKADHVIADNKSEHRLGSVGRESFHVQVRTIDESGRLLPAGKEGEVIVRGDLVMKGYWKDSEATAETIKNGWLYTGDIGYFDEDGYLFLTNRKKDVIITGGANVYPREVEEILYRHPAVLEACVFGVPDSKWGERIVAAVVCRKDITVSEEDLISWCRKQLAGYKKPSQISFVSNLPKSGIGKILKREVKEQFLAEA